MNLPDALDRGAMPAGWAANRSGVPAENDGLLSLALSSKGGEGNNAAACEQRAASKEPRGRAHSADVASSVTPPLRCSDG